MGKPTNEGKNQNKKTKAFPWVMPKEKPTDRPIREAMRRLYDGYGPYGDRYNEFFSNFKYTKINGKCIWLDLIALSPKIMFILNLRLKDISIMRIHIFSLILQQINNP